MEKKDDNSARPSAQKRMKRDYSGLGVISAPWMRLFKGGDGEASISRGLRVLRTIVRAADEVLGDVGTTDADAKMLPGMRAGLIEIFDELLNDQRLNSNQRATISAAVETAFAIGLVVSQSQVAQEIQGEWQRERTRAANQGRRAESVQKIVEEEARKLWARKKRNLGDTANVIRPRVMRRVAMLEKVPRAWLTCEPNDEQERARQVERIRKRLKRINEADE